MVREVTSDKIVIKIGTSTLMTDEGALDLAYVEKLAAVISGLKAQKKQVVLVTSGAIGVGLAKLKPRKRPTLIPEKQAIAAVGQCLLMAAYDKCFAVHGFSVGQVLITKDCLDSVQKYGNAINTFGALLAMDVLPVVNENDTVGVDEIISIGDNDTLSAHVATMINADVLILLSDIDGLYDKNPEDPDAKLISEVTEINEDIREYAGGAGSTLGTGGMVTKLDAAVIAGRNGTKTILVNGRDPRNVEAAIKGEQIGTYFNL